MEGLGYLVCKETMDRLEEEEHLDLKDGTPGNNGVEGNTGFKGMPGRVLFL